MFIAVFLITNVPHKDKDFGYCYLCGDVLSP